MALRQIVPKRGLGSYSPLVTDKLNPEARVAGQRDTSVTQLQFWAQSMGGGRKRWKESVWKEEAAGTFGRPGRQLADSANAPISATAASTRYLN